MRGQACVMDTPRLGFGHRRSIMRTAIRASLAIVVLAGAAALPSADARAAGGGLATCSYQYGRWQATGSDYWRALYDVCVNVADEPAQD
jgi:hypothetical protein